jgi:hypothetical protein
VVLIVRQVAWIAGLAWQYRVEEDAAFELRGQNGRQDGQVPVVSVSDDSSHCKAAYTKADLSMLNDIVNCCRCHSPPIPCFPTLTNPLSVPISCCSVCVSSDSSQTATVSLFLFWILRHKDTAFYSHHAGHNINSSIQHSLKMESRNLDHRRANYKGKTQFSQTEVRLYSLVQEHG